jgi:iron(III) transport system ATP-binding protein
MQNDKPLLTLNNISQHYGDTTVVDGLSLTLARGRIGCLLGPSGCGKTTVLRCIAGFEEVSGGQITLDGEVVSDVQGHLPPEKRRIGMVFQDYALFPHLTAEQNIGFGLNKLSRAERKQRQDELLTLIGLSDAGRLYPHQLSGGQQQRIALARALAPRPQLLLLDEPFSNLDVELRERLCHDVRDIIKREGTTALMVTHDQHEAFAVADEIAIMHRGTIQQWDSAYNLYHRPANRFVADFIGKGVFLQGVVIEGNRVETELGMLEGELHAPCSRGCVVDVLLRPDDIVHDDHSPQTAIVIDKAFQGSSILYTLQLPSGTPILALVPSHHDHTIGQAIGIRLATDHVIAFNPQLGE